MLSKVRIGVKHAWARSRGSVEAVAGDFHFLLDTRGAVNVGQVLNLRKRISRNQWEPAFLRTLFEVLRPDETLFEVGTWIGPYSIIIAKKILKTGRLIGFEPDPVAFSQCVRNLRINNVQNAFVLPFAVSNELGTIGLYTNRIFGNSGSSIFESNPIVEGYDHLRIDVPAVTLDQVSQTLGIEPTTVKLDIEGAEDLAIEGGARVISRPEVKALVEIHHAYLKIRDKSANTVLRQLADLGKEIYFADDLDGAPYKYMERMDPAKNIEVENFHVLAR